MQKMPTRHALVDVKMEGSLVGGQEHRLRRNHIEVGIDAQFTAIYRQCQGLFRCASFHKNRLLAGTRALMLGRSGLAAHRACAAKVSSTSLALVSARPPLKPESSQPA